jgi:hypothetical protein
VLFLSLLILSAPSILLYFGFEIKYLSKESFLDHIEQDQSETPTSYIKQENCDNINAIKDISETLVTPKQDQTLVNLETNS